VEGATPAYNPETTFMCGCGVKEQGKSWNERCLAWDDLDIDDKHHDSEGRCGNLSSWRKHNGKGSEQDHTDFKCDPWL